MEFLQSISFGNYMLFLAVLGWVVAQVGKAVLHLIIHKEFSLERLLGSGGMPSSHSAMVCALFMAAARKTGVSSPEFAITLVLAAIVMYDAMGVRLETGKQAKLLNQIVEDLQSHKFNTEKRLKELVGHTPIQVLSGALLGILLALLVPVF